jgi:hypothetical protein
MAAGIWQPSDGELSWCMGSIVQLGCKEEAPNELDTAGQP